MDTAKLQKPRFSENHARSETPGNTCDSLDSRLLDLMENLTSDLFDELDDFLFSSVRPDALVDDSPQIKLIREYRNKKRLFESQFLSFIREVLDGSSLAESLDNAVSSPFRTPNNGNSVFENMEIDLALERMQRKALRRHSAQIRNFEDLHLGGEENQTALIRADTLECFATLILQALSISHGVFRVSLENRLVFLKLFERLFLLQMEQLTSCWLSSRERNESQNFADQLAESLGHISETDQRIGFGQLATDKHIRADCGKHRGTKKLVALIDELIDGWCRNSELGESIELMLREDWRAVMYVVAVNKGTESQEWREAARTIELLMQRMTLDFSAEIDQSEDDSLLNRLRLGLDLIQKPATEKQEILSVLQNLFGIDDNDHCTPKISGNRKHRIDDILSSTFASFSEAGRKILDRDDLDDFIELLGDDQQQAIAELDDETISMDYYLNLVNSMADTSLANLSILGSEGKCRIEKSASIDGSYRVLDQNGRVLLTRGRIGLAVSLRAGEIKLEGQQDYLRSRAARSH